MKVFLAYPWMFRDSAYYKYLVEFPPKGVVYANAKRKFSVTHSQSKLSALNSLKRKLNRLRNIVSVPNIKFVKGDYDLVHCARCLNVSNIPYVVDVEGYWSLGGTDSANPLGFRIASALMRRDTCKKIMPWSQTTFRRMEMVFHDPKIINKMEVLYPAVPSRPATRQGKNTLLFVSRYFWIKGGLVALEVMKRLKEKYDVETIIVSDVPDEIKKKYENLNFVGLQPMEKMSEIYSKSGIFLYPSFSDTFGLTQLEAMSYGLPIVTVDDGSARREIVDDGENGFVVETPVHAINEVLNEKRHEIVGSNLKMDYRKIGKREEKIVRGLVEKTSLLIEDGSLRKKMSSKARELTTTGKFSIASRNKRLKEIYEESAQR